MKSILELSNVEAKEFFLKQESYCSIDFPIYFCFQPLLDAVSDEIDNKSISDFYSTYFDKEKNKNRPTVPCNYEGANYLSIPVKSEDEKSDKAALIEQWWIEIEQQSIELGLDYEFILYTDISNCYGSFYTHSIAWALHGKNNAKKKRNDKKLIGNVIDECVRNMTYGQTNGIPQGSVLMDFIAEMILGFVDLQLTELITNSNINDYKILRYRDDYRIFTNNSQDTEIIVKYLTEVLIDLGMKLNSNKTIASSNVVRDSLKPDKLYWINHKQYSKSLQDEFFIIHSLSEKYPNSGVLAKLLMKLYDRIIKNEEEEAHLSVLISIVVDIMVNNPRVYPISTAILSKLLSLQEDNDIRKKTIKKIVNRFNKVPNTGYLEIWLQRMVLNLDTAITFPETLCKKVRNEQIVIWNSEWLDGKLKELIDSYNIIDTNEVNRLDRVINRSEVELFRSTYWES
jgi:hypothetical protein